MRIAYINKTPVEAALPAVNFSLHFAYGMAQTGARTDLFLQRESPSSTPDMLLDRFGLPSVPGFRAHLHTVSRHTGIATNQWFYLSVVRSLLRERNKEPFDAVISRDPGALPYLAFVKSINRVPVFYQPHNFYADLSIRPDLSRKNAVKYRFLERTFIPRLTGLVCILQPQADLFRRYFPRTSVRTLRPGIVTIFPPQTTPWADKPVIGYLGSLQLKKGIETLLGAAAALRGHQVRFVLIGGRSHREIEPVRSRIAEMGLGARVRITGWLSPSEAGREIANLAAAVIPLEGTFYNRYLTAPNKLYDALAHGVPIIAADLPSIRDVVSANDGCLFYQPGETATLARRIEEVLAFDRSEMARRRSLTSSAAERLSWVRRFAELREALSADGSAVTS